MRPLVECAGKPWYAGWLSRVWDLSGADRGTRWVGGRRVRWFVGRAGVTVLHPDAGSRRIHYHVQLTETRLPSGGVRAWWLCPGCEGQVDICTFLRVGTNSGADGAAGWRIGASTPRERPAGGRSGRSWSGTTTSDGGSGVDRLDPRQAARG